MAEGGDQMNTEADSHSELSDAEKELATQATIEFKKEQYEECASCLKKLMTTRKNDPKVVNNKAALDYLRSGLQRTDEFRQALQTAAQLTGITLEQPEQIDDADQAVIFYNFAVILFHQRQYSQALTVLDSLIPFVKTALEDAFTRRQLFLHMEVFLKLQRPEKVLQKCAGFEKQLANQAGEAKEAGEQPQFSEIISTDKFKSEVQLFKMKALLMIRSLKQAKKETKSLHGLGFVTHAVLFLKAHFEYLKGNHRKALKIIAGIPSPLTGPLHKGECETIMHWNNLGCIHFHMGKHNLGAMYFRRAMKQNDKAVEDAQQSAKKSTAGGKGASHAHLQIPVKAYSISKHYEILHNLGLELLFSGKPTAAFDYLLEVINIYPKNARLWMRLAECCIKAYRPNNDVDRKFEARMQCVLRSVGAGPYRKLVLGSGVNESKKPWEESAAMPTPTLEFGSLCVRNALLQLPRELTGQGLGAGDSEELRHSKIIKWAELQAIPVQPCGFIRGLDLIHLRSSILASGAYIALCLNHYVDAIDMSRQLLSQSLLSGAHRYLGRMYLAEAYVFQDKIVEAMSLLAHDQIDSVQLTVSTMGSGDEGGQGGKGSSGRDGESSEEGLSGHHSGTQQGTNEETAPLTVWQPATLSKARGIIMYNQAATLAIRGDYERARKMLIECINGLASRENPPPAHFYFLRIYLELMQGRRQTALFFIKEHFGHLCQPGVGQLPMYLLPGNDAAAGNTNYASVMQS